MADFLGNKTNPAWAIPVAFLQLRLLFPEVPLGSSAWLQDPDHLYSAYTQYVLFAIMVFVLFKICALNVLNG